MTGVLLVGAGGVLGGLCRFRLGRILARLSGPAFPLATFLVNVTGAFLLGLLSGSGASGGTVLLLGDGFLGAYTTFSTLMYEGFTLFRKNAALNAFVYIAGTLALGVCAFLGGLAAAGPLFA